MSDQLIRGIRLPNSVSRRDVLRYSLAGAGLVALGPLTRFLPSASGAPQTLKRLVVVNCYGGNDTLNMFVPVKLQPYYLRRSNLALGESECLDLSSAGAAWGTSQYRLHPSMPKVAALWAAGQVAAVNRVGYPTANLSHFSSQDIYSTGVRGAFGDLGIPTSGWVARFCDHYAPSALGAVAVGVGRPLDIIGGATSPLPVNTLSAFKIQGAGGKGDQYTPAHYHRLGTAKKLIDTFDGTGHSVSARTALGQAHDLTSQVQGAITNYTSPVTYTTEQISARMKDIAILIKGGFESRILYTGFGGFDTHSAQGTTAGLQATLFGQLDRALGAFADDMKAMGVWNDMVIAVITEFGRRNYVNGSNGTDHGHAYTALLLGGAVKGGVKGPDLVDADINSEYPSYGVDFRSIYKEVLTTHMGFNPAPVFPEALVVENTLGFVQTSSVPDTGRHVPSARRTAFRIAAASAAVFGVIVVAEIALRLTLEDRFVPEPPAVRAEAVLGRHDPELGWSLTPGARARVVAERSPYDVVLNSRGFRDPERGAREKGVRRIVLLGDSYGFGWGVAQDASFAALLERDPRVGAEVVNLSVPGYSTDQELWSLERESARLAPDLVLVEFCPNDPEGDETTNAHRMLKPMFLRLPGGAWTVTNLPTPTFLPVAAEPPSWGERSMSWSAVWQVVSGRTPLAPPPSVPRTAERRPGAPRPEPFGAESPSRHAFELLVARCRSLGARLVVFGIPTFGEPESPPLTQDGVEYLYEMNRSLARLGSELGFATCSVDRVLHAAWASGADITVPDGHWNAAGHRLAADSLAPQLAHHLAAASRR